MSRDCINADELNDSEKLSILTVGYNQISSEIRHAENQEHRITIGISSLLLVVAGFIIKLEQKPPGPILFILSGICVAFSWLAIWFLIQNGRQTILLFKDLIRIEEILGFHKPNTYITDEVISSWQDTPFQESRVFVSDGKSWAKRKLPASTSPHIIAVLMMGLALAVVILLSAYLGQK